MITRGKKMSNEEIKTMLETIKHELETKATNAKIEELMKQLKKRDDKIDGLEKKIDKLEKDNENVVLLGEKVKTLEEKIDSLESQVIVAKNANVLLERKIDDGEQYTRRTSLRINGIACGEKEKETAQVCLDKVKAEVSKLGLDPESYSFDRAHRIGKERRDSKGKPLPRQMIVRLLYWSDRNEIYQARPKERGAKVKFYADLTKRRLDLKKLAIEHVKDLQNVDFVFTDINCNLVVRFKDGQLRYFNSVEELNRILS